MSEFIDMLCDIVSTAEIKVKPLCLECSRVSEIKCLDCKENYCKPCYWEHWREHTERDPKYDNNYGITR